MIAISSYGIKLKTEGFDLAQVDTALNFHANIFNFCGLFFFVISLHFSYDLIFTPLFAFFDSLR
jgi:hypothetical protein